MMESQERTVVITGASAGLGRAIAHAFARERCRIGFLSRNRERLERVRMEVEELGGTALILIADVADPNPVEHAASLVEQKFVPIDVWLNNAMAQSPLPEPKCTG